ncbi:lipolpqB domain protein [Mycobacterium xenopi 4042]|uniref:LipolpqB domain protein n=1 Tax=Mycobacterium xenopi 4042 TaxID=1299334 RepID=X7YIF9_MYCXE|nr:lipolpqB domain protein [Mycobacterium xenopi 4042]
MRPCRIHQRRKPSAPSRDRRRRTCPSRPGMDPDVLLREFLKATADPANRHLAARQFLTQSASNAWDDAGSALLIDHVVFVETRTAERVSVTMRADILGSLSDMGCSRPPRECCRIPDRSSWSKLPGLAHRPAAERGVFGLAAVPGDLQAQRAVFRRPDRQDGGARSALRRRLRSRPAGHRAGLQTDRRTTPGDVQVGAQSARSTVAAAWTGDPSRRRQNRSWSWVRRARVDLESLSATDPHSRQLLAAQIIWTLARPISRGRM